MNRLRHFLFVIALVATVSADAALRLPKIIGSNMVLQQKQRLPIWGWAYPWQTVTVRFAGQIKTTTAAADGAWRVTLDPMNASAVPRDMVIVAGDKVTLTNVLVGEVWLCGGQSNMEYTMKTTYAKPARGADSLALELNANIPDIRLFLVDKVLSKPDVTTKGWNIASGDALGTFSAAGYFFGKELHAKLKVPVGMIASSWGGSRIEPWTPAEGYVSLPAFAAETRLNPIKISDVEPGKNYASMIAPLAPFAVKGFLWYQGESNLMIHDGMRYADKMLALVQSWRKAWEEKDAPFYFVQIAPYYYTKRKDPLPHTAQTLPEFWEAQQEATRIPHTGMIVTTDLVDNLADIHPPYKWVVGHRLAGLALANDYGKKGLETSGPVFKSMTVKNGRAILSFTHAAGLSSRDGKPLNWFTVAGADGLFVPANAVIVDGKVEVSAAGVAHPKAVRFAWDETAMPNMQNSTGLPATPFRTDALRWGTAR